MLTLKENKNYLFALDLSVITVTGEKTSEFLQGQLTCDVKKINETNMQSGAYCNLKGRVLALLDVVLWQGFQLVLHKNLSEAIKRSLAKTALVSRVSLHDNPASQVYGFYYNNRTDLSPFQSQLPEETCAQKSENNACIYNIGDNYYILLVSPEEKEKLCKPFLEAKQFLGFSEWHTLQVRRKRFEIYPNTQGLFLPHRVDLHKNGTISFDKGCYKGQEIIARTHYRATLKHSLQLYRVHSNQPPVAGMKVFKSDGRTEIGELVDFSPLSNEDYLVLISILYEHPLEVILEGFVSPIRLELPAE